MGFVTPDVARKTAGKRRLMIVTEGKPNTGKTEFLLTAPGPGLIIALDRGFDAMCDNPHPPKTRRADFGLNVIKVPTLGAGVNPAKEWVPYWNDFYATYKNALANPDAKTVCLDGDNVSWELQRLAEHGTLTGIFPQTRYTGVYDARRKMYFRAWDSGKIIICTNMVRDQYRDVIDTNTGLPVMENGQAKREKTGDSTSMGFPDQDYLFQIRIRHLFEPARENPILKKKMPARWGFRILAAKANPTLVGSELWGTEATFTGLVEAVYPHIDPKEWGL
jgi:hypothetical protein